ncbi:glucans biosynthesis glucosyltransferase MdoH [Marinobacter adhaerens]|uniref:Glucans biosynthesis glucosyltransferase H n=1 Tax=Marinobacter adhaerens TaxID=1033846 RepID=A0A851HVU1_9GAMM|nr:glucans biosynthesis glucosyltransferase MdoH [Marinobacter adhaerens]NWN91402.1 glucans biosynthesis glucosyltransferase MdoH [Marinobacter adhaerens]
MIKGQTTEPRRHRWRLVANLRRTVFMLFVFGQTGVASYYLLWVLPYHGGTALEISMLVLFAILYAWIAVGFWTAVLGFVIRLMGGDRHSIVKRHTEAQLLQTPMAKTAVLLPVYHEPVHWTLSGLKAVYRDIERTGQIDHFEFYILSDSRDPDVWLEEQVAWNKLARELGGEGRIFYRRRPVNLNYKSGNVADFLRRWGKRCTYMVVLDADSLMTGSSIVRMVRLMQREPDVGILQTNPNIINGQSLFARIQQFANRFYSTLFASGLAAIQMGDAAFWGHNAILRIEPFMKHCGLRKLPGIGIFGGPIMSHDFVEAAYMGRAGYEVWLEPALGGSYEESPPTLADELARDSRWAKGNIQHLWVMLTEPGLRFAHRMAFLNGIMAYVASPLWLAFLVLTTIAAANMALSPIEYFPDGHQGLFPLWPEWRPEWALGLALSTLALLFFPKFLAIFDAIIHRYTKAFGGLLRLFLSVVLESLISVLLAPVRMWAHSRYVVSALLNVSLQWAGQNRTEETGWKEAFITQLPGMLLGGAWSVFAWSLDTLFFFWSLPVALPLVLAAPTAVYLSRVSLGQALRERRLLLIPEENKAMTLLRDAVDYRAREPSDSILTPLEQAVLRLDHNRLHQALAWNHRRGSRALELERCVAQCLEQGPGALSRSEMSQVARDRQSLRALHAGAWRASPDNYWGRAITRLSSETYDTQV